MVGIGRDRIPRPGPVRAYEVGPTPRGLTAQDIAFAVNMLAGGFDIAKYNDKPGDGQRYDVRVKARESDLDNPADLHRVMLRTRSGELVRLDSVAQIDPVIGPAVINRLNLQYAANFYVTPAVPLGGCRCRGVA